MATWAHAPPPKVLCIINTSTSFFVANMQKFAQKKKTLIMTSSCGKFKSLLILRKKGFLNSFQSPSTWCNLPHIFLFVQFCDIAEVVIMHKLI